MAEPTPTTKPSRRLFLATAPIAALLTSRFAITDVDPIFLAIERHKEAIRAYNATEEDTAAYDAASTVECDALADFLETVPATAAGVRAAILHVTSIDLGYYVKDMVPTLLKSPIFSA